MQNESEAVNQQLVNFFNKTPDEIVKHIFEYLDENSIMQLYITCSRFYKLLKTDSNFLKKYAPHLNILSATYSPIIKQATIKDLLEEEKVNLTNLKIKIEEHLTLLDAKTVNLTQFKNDLESYTIASINCGQFFKFNPKLTLAFLIQLAIFIVFTPIATIKSNEFQNQANVAIKNYSNSSAWDGPYFGCDSWDPDYDNCQRYRDLADHAQNLVIAWCIPEAAESFIFVILVIAMAYQYFHRNDSLPTYANLSVKDLTKEHSKKWEEFKKEYAAFLQDNQINTIQDIINWINGKIVDKESVHELWLEGNALLNLCKDMIISVKTELNNHSYSSNFQGHAKGKIHQDAYAFFNKHQKKIEENKVKNLQLNFFDFKNEQDEGQNELDDETNPQLSHQKSKNQHEITILNDEEETPLHTKTRSNNKKLSDVLIEEDEDEQEKHDDNSEFEF